MWNKTSNSPAQTSISQIRFHLSCKERRRGRVSKRNVKTPVLSLLTSESDINLSLGENSQRSTK